MGLISNGKTERCLRSVFYLQLQRFYFCSSAFTTLTLMLSKAFVSDSIEFFAASNFTVTVLVGTSTYTSLIPFS